MVCGAFRPFSCSVALCFFRLFMKVARTWKHKIPSLLTDVNLSWSWFGRLLGNFSFIVHRCFCYIKFSKQRENFALWYFEHFLKLIGTWKPKFYETLLMEVNFHELDLSIFILEFFLSQFMGVVATWIKLAKIQNCAILLCSFMKLIRTWKPKFLRYWWR